MPLKSRKANFNDAGVALRRETTNLSDAEITLKNKKADSGDTGVALSREKAESKPKSIFMLKRLRAAACFLTFLSALFGAFFVGGGAFYPPRCGGVRASGGSAYIAIERDSARVLYGSNIDARLPMASTTKIMTALVAIEKNDIKKRVKIPKAAVGIEGSSIYLRENEEMTVEDLLYGLMLTSGNDSAAALAIVTAGSVEDFAAMMNKRAKEIGAKNTNFTNPHGLHDARHYTSAYDLALITAHALKNPVFQTIVSAEKYTISDAGGGAGARYLSNKNKMLKMYCGADGVKTGFTKNSGRCLVASAKRGDMRVITVVLNHADMWNDSMSLLDRSFDNYKIVKIAGAEQTVDAPVAGGARGFAAAAPEDKYYPVKADERLSYEILPEKLKAPVKKGAVAGKIKISIDNHLIFEEKLYTIDSVKEKSALDRLKDLFD